MTAVLRAAWMVVMWARSTVGLLVGPLAESWVALWECLMVEQSVATKASQRADWMGLHWVGLSAELMGDQSVGLSADSSAVHSVGEKVVKKADELVGPSAGGWAVRLAEKWVVWWAEKLVVVTAVLKAGLSVGGMVGLTVGRRAGLWEATKAGRRDKQKVGPSVHPSAGRTAGGKAVQMVARSVHLRVGR